MADLVLNPYPQPWINPDEPGLLAGYTPHCDNELAQWGRVLNRAASGAIYDLSVRVGCPIVGQGGGILVTDNSANAQRSPVVIPVPPATQAHEVDMQYDALPTATRYVVAPGWNSGTYLIVVNGIGTRITLNNAGTFTVIGDMSGRGPHRVGFSYDGANQFACLNGRFVAQNACAPTAIGGPGHVGDHSTVRLWKAYNINKTVAEFRASYIREFARKVVYQWKPSAVGERSFATGNVGEGDFYCPSGGAGLSTVWRPNLSEPGGGHLALTGDNAPSMARLDFMHPRMPIFGSWLIEYEVRNPAWAGDSPIIGFTPMRGVDPTVAGSQSYWLNMYNNGGGWFRTSLYYENGAQIDGADLFAASVLANDRNKCLLTHDVDGSWQVYTYNSSIRRWGWTTATPIDVSNLNSNYLTIIPRGGYVTGVTRYQGSMTPHELETTLP